jgi:hypothetical protein
MQSYEIDVLEPLLNQSKTAKQRELAPLQARGIIEWLLLHHFPSKIRKSKMPALQVSSLLSRGRILLQLQCNDNDNGNDTNIGTAATNTNNACACSEENEINHEMWEKGVRLALKKIQVQDLGNMNASELQLAIPMEDSEGRGMTDLISLEKKLAVKVVFDQESGHVLIVGDEKKLEKKVFVIRNMISHYHWRLSGTDVAFDKITSTTR